MFHPLALKYLRGWHSSSRFDIFLKIIDRKMRQWLPMIMQSMHTKRKFRPVVILTVYLRQYGKHDRNMVHGRPMILIEPESYNVLLANMNR